MEDGNLIKDCTTTSFRADVITESAGLPVLVDFWAPRCAPCQKLTPFLEKVVKKAAGKVKLAKMNVEDNPEIARQLNVQSIPAVIAFQKGQPADGFMGALPEPQVIAFLERLVGPLAGAEENLCARAASAFEEGNLQLAADLYQEALSINSSDPNSIVGCARANIALGNLHKAREILDGQSHSLARDAGLLAARAALENAEQAAIIGDLADLENRLAIEPQDHTTRLDYAIALNARGEHERAANELLDIIRRARTWNDDAARKQLLQFFEAWGHDDTNTLTARRKLSGVLFS